MSNQWYRVNMNELEIAILDEADRIIEYHPLELEKFSKLRDKTISFLMGQVLKREPNANTHLVRKLLVERL